MKKKYKHISDEELDQLFRNAAEQFRPPHATEDAWQDFLNGHLVISESSDADGREKARPYILNKKRGVLSPFGWPLKIAACLLIVLGSLWLISKKENKTDEQIKTFVQTDRKTNKIVDEPKISNKPGNEEIIKFSKTEAARNTLATSSSISKQDGPASEIQNILTSFNKAGSKLLPQQRDSIVRNKPADNNADIKNNYPGSLIVTLKPNTNSKLKDNNTSPYQTRNVSYKNSYSKWQIGILAGPNLSMVGTNISNQPGFNAGMVVQKKLGDSRFSLESGVIYESMVYNVANKDFNPDNKPVSSKVSNIEGTCSMIDVPLNVRYDIVASKKGKAFISTGVSPTLIVAQSYIYDLERENETVRIDRDVSGQGKSLYAVANVSIGYEQKWDRTSVQIAPYLKIPTGEIGYGNLNLGGVGTQVSIKRDL